MGIKVFDIIDIAVAGALEQHTEKRLNETVLSKIRKDCGDMEAAAVEPFAVQPDIDMGSLTLSFERQYDNDYEALAPAFSSCTPCIAMSMDGGYSVAFTYEGVFQ